MRAFFFFNYLLIYRHSIDNFMTRILSLSLLVYPLLHTYFA